jgi:hypothetical protein
MITLAILLIAAQASPSHPSAAAAVATAPSSDGVWDGGITVPAGLTIPFELDLAGSAGRFAAPDQQVRDVPVTVTTDGRRILISLPGGSARFEASLSDDGATLSGTWTRGGQSFPARFSRGESIKAAKSETRPQTPLAPFPYQATDVSVPTAADLKLGATLTRPSSPTAVPAVLLLGGNGPQTRDETYAGHRPMMLVADRLTRAGFAVLRYDKRGVGDSTGRYETATGADLVSDARAALRWLRAQPGIDPRRTCVLGLSEGAMIAPMVAATDDPACVVLLSPPGVPSPALLGEQTRMLALDDGKSAEAAGREAAAARSVVEGMARGVERNDLVARAIAAGATATEAEALVRNLDSAEVRVFLADDPAVALRKLSMPVLVLAGGNDHQVVTAQNVGPVRKALAGNRSARVVILPGLNHLLQPSATGAVRDYAANDVTMDEHALTEIVGFVRKASTTGRAPE